MTNRRKFTDYERKTVYANGNGRCAICGRPIRFKDMTVDHKIPLSKNGNNDMKNLQPACRECNFLKNQLTMEEFSRKISEAYWNLKGKKVIEYIK